jgi:hypothetical protein
MLPAGVVLLVAAVVLLGHNGYAHDARFWVYYAILVGFTVLFAATARTQTIVAVVLVSAGFGALAEWLGARAGLWAYASGSVVPPLWLVAVSWPLEGLLHFGLSAIVAGEPPDPPRFRRRETAGQFAPRKDHPMYVRPETSKVFVRRGGDDKRALLDRAIDDAGLLAHLAARHAKSGRRRPTTASS